MTTYGYLRLPLSLSLYIIYVYSYVYIHVYEGNGWISSRALAGSRAGLEAIASRACLQGLRGSTPTQVDVAFGAQQLKAGVHEGQQSCSPTSNGHPPATSCFIKTALGSLRRNTSDVFDVFQRQSLANLLKITNAVWRFGTCTGNSKAWDSGRFSSSKYYQQGSSQTFNYVDYIQIANKRMCAYIYIYYIFMYLYMYVHVDMYIVPLRRPSAYHVPEIRTKDLAGSHFELEVARELLNRGLYYQIMVPVSKHGCVCICLCICLSIFLSIYLPIDLYLCICLFVYLSIYLSLYPSRFLSIYVHIVAYASSIPQHDVGHDSGLYLTQGT